MIGILRGEGKFMTEEKNLQQMIEEDLEQCEIVWTQFYDNKESMEALFLMLISHYIDRINGFAENIEVLNGWEKVSQQIEICRRNILLLIERIKLFQQNGYSNEGLLDLYLKQEREKEIICLRYGLAGAQEVTQREIADAMGISRSYSPVIIGIKLEKE